MFGAIFILSVHNTTTTHMFWYYYSLTQQTQQQMNFLRCILNSKTNSNLLIELWGQQQTRRLKTLQLHDYTFDGSASVVSNPFNCADEKRNVIVENNFIVGGCCTLYREVESTI
jgi:hypothetical protein